MDEGQNSQRSMVYLSIQHMYESDSRHLPVLALKLIHTSFTSNFTKQVAERVMEHQPCTKCEI